MFTRSSDLAGLASSRRSDTKRPFAGILRTFSSNFKLLSASDTLTHSHTCDPHLHSHIPVFSSPNIFKICRRRVRFELAFVFTFNLVPLRLTMYSPDPTRRLPAEILVKIFQAWHYFQTHGFDTQWIRATWVCQRWRQVALDTAVLWSSVFVSRRISDDPVLELHLDRARGAALNLVVFCGQMSNGDLEEVLNLVLSRATAIERLSVTCYDGQQTAVKAFIKDAGTELVSLSLTDHSGGDNHEWEFTPDVFPRLRHLALYNVVPTPGATGPLLTLIHLALRHSQGGSSVDLFLAACTNLETLRTDAQSISNKRDEHTALTLPNLRYLSMEPTMHEAATALSHIRLPSLTSFHISDHEDLVGGDFTAATLPQNICKVLPPIRRTRCLSLVVGGMWEDLSLKGGLGDACHWQESARDEPAADWSISPPNFWYYSAYPRCYEDPSGSVTGPELLAEHFTYLARIGAHFVRHVPHLVDPSRLVELQLHLARGLPDPVHLARDRDWAGFFAPMCHLRTLGIGGFTLVSAVLTTFGNADPGLCNELKDVALCAPAEWVVDELGLGLSFQADVMSWVRGHVRAGTGTGTGLRCVTIRMEKEHPREHEGRSENLYEATVGNAGPSPIGFREKLRQGFGWLEEVVGEDIVVRDAYCTECRAAYELPEGYPEWRPEETGTEGSGRDEPYFY